MHGMYSVYLVRLVFFHDIVSYTNINMWMHIHEYKWRCYVDSYLDVYVCKYICIQFYLICSYIAMYTLI